MVRKELLLNPVRIVTAVSPMRLLQKSQESQLGHQFNDKEFKMYDPECLNSAQGPTKTNKGWQAPRMKGQMKTVGMKAAQ